VNVLPPRPFRLRTRFLVETFVGMPLVAGGALCLAIYGTVHAAVIALMLAVAAFKLVERWLLARDVAKESDELPAKLVHLDRERHRANRANLAMESRRYQFEIDGYIEKLLAPTPATRPLFLDAEHTQGLALRARSGRLMIVSTTLWPFAFTADEERAIRERIETLREVRKMVNDIHTC
jgi:hypothetical protein